MYLVVDPNVIFSAVLGIGNSWFVFAKNIEDKLFTLISPLFAIIETGKHIAEIAERTKFSFEEAQDAFNIIIKRIRFIPEEDYKDKTKEAREILKEHEKDVPYVALALKYNCKILSGDKTLKELIPEMVLTPREILNGFF